MRKSYYIFIFVVISLSLFLFFKKNKLDLDIEKIDVHESYIIAHVLLENNTRKTIKIDQLSMPFEYNFTAIDLTDPSSIIRHIPISNAPSCSITLNPMEKRKIEIPFLAIMSRGSHNIEISFIDANQNVIMRSEKCIHIENPIECKNFSKNADLR